MFKMYDGLRQNLYKKNGAVESEVKLRVENLTNVARHWVQRLGTTLSKVRDGIRFVMRATYDISVELGMSRDAGLAMAGKLLMQHYIR